MTRLCLCFITCLAPLGGLAGNVFEKFVCMYVHMYVSTYVRRNVRVYVRTYYVLCMFACMSLIVTKIARKWLNQLIYDFYLGVTEQIWIRDNIRIIELMQITLQLNYISVLPVKYDFAASDDDDLFRCITLSGLFNFGLLFILPFSY